MVAIIAILAVIAVPNFLEAQTRSRISRSMSDMRSIGMACEAYHVDHNRYIYGTVSAGDIYYLGKGEGFIGTGHR